MTGFGKTWLIANYINWYATRKPGLRISVCAQTTGDIRKTLFRGVSGILKTAHPDRRPIYVPSNKEATYRNGSIISTFSAELDDGPAGTAADLLVFDELFLFSNASAIWDEFMFTLREGEDQQIIVASTPRSNSLAKELLTQADDEVTLITGSTSENISLSEKFHKRINKRYKGTRLGRQELNGELLMDNPDSMFDSASIEKNKVTSKFFKSISDQIDRMVIAVDPSTTNNRSSDLCGICVVAKIDDHAYVLNDLSLKASPEDWAKIVCDNYDLYNCDLVIAETNQGGDLVEVLLRQHDANINLRKIHARVGKYTRAEPVSAAVQRGQVHFVIDDKEDHNEDKLDSLIEECVTWSPKVGRSQKSPDRMDAFVYAVTELLIKKTVKPWAF